MVECEKCIFLEFDRSTSHGTLTCERDARLRQDLCRSVNVFNIIISHLTYVGHFHSQRSCPFIRSVASRINKKKETKRNEETRQHSHKTKIYSRLRAVTHSNDVVKCKTLIIPCAGGTDRRTMQMKSHIRLNSIFLDVTILPFLCRNSECVLQSKSATGNKIEKSFSAEPQSRSGYTAPRSALTLPEHAEWQAN